jgi:hypothetical protein
LKEALTAVILPMQPMGSQFAQQPAQQQQQQQRQQQQKPTVDGSQIHK